MSNMDITRLFLSVRRSAWFSVRLNSITNSALNYGIRLLTHTWSQVEVTAWMSNYVPRPFWYVITYAACRFQVIYVSSSLCEFYGVSNVLLPGDLLAHNGLWPGGAMSPHRTWSTLFQVMACRLFVAEALPEAMLTYCQLDPYEASFSEIWIGIQTFSLRENTIGNVVCGHSDQICTMFNE